MAPNPASMPIWTPSAERIAGTRLQQFVSLVGERNP